MKKRNTVSMSGEKLREYSLFSPHASTIHVLLTVIMAIPVELAHIISLLVNSLHTILGHSNSR